MTALSDWFLTPWRVAIHLPTSTAVVADLHLGYDVARRRAGEAIPPTRIEDVLAPLGVALLQAGCRSLVLAGDVFEAGYRQDLLDSLLGWLRQSGVVLTAIVPGNHDRGLEQAPSLPIHPQGFTLGRWHIVHGDGRLPRGPVVYGHWHPCLRWDGLTFPCFLHTANQLVLPAYSSDAAGVNVLASARWSGFRCSALGGDSVLDLGEVAALRVKRRQVVRGSR